MALHEIKPMRGECLYDRDSNLVGKWNGDFGMFADCFVERVITCRIVTRRDESGDLTEMHSCCGDLHTRDAFTGRPFRYCPNCGARCIEDGGSNA